MKNEGPFILDWIAHHRAVGVRDFLVYTNDCDDGTVALLDRLAARGALVRRDNPLGSNKGKTPQHAALIDAADCAPAVDAEWILPIDVDEYVNIRPGAGTFADLLAAAEALAGAAPEMISLPWRLFGSDGTEGFRDKPVTAQFTRCAAAWRPKPHQAWGFKTAFRAGVPYARFGVHRPVKPHDGAAPVWLDGSGRPMPRKFIGRGWRMDKHCWGYDLVQLNHYAVRSAESFLVKRARGRVNHTSRDQGLQYWWVMNRNEDEDRSILRLRRAAREEMQALKADPEVRRLHQACLRAHRRKIKALRADPEHAELLARLVSPGFDALSRIDGAFGTAWFEEGPPPEAFEPGDGPILRAVRGAAP
ncbi:glycosyltransferase family 2 protein [Rhodovulum sp. DZ06]|uniref:glycosyltransferase family 2 protein n=1 Tax=Rhodovulum sp. DZ06 TaxID=3425126 RepID=UPI003D32913B